MDNCLDLNDFKHYCQCRIRKLIAEHQNQNISYARGQYVAYNYGLKVVAHYKKNKLLSSKHSLYQVFKKSKDDAVRKYIDDQKLRDGVRDGLYDLMNYVYS